MSAPLKVNFSDKEASSEARDFEPVPSGKYNAKVTEITLEECGENSKNPGKPYWNIEFTIQDGQYTDRKVWSNCMLFSPALYTFSQLMKALGYNVEEGDFEVPDPDELISRDVSLKVVKMRDEYKMEKEGSGDVLWKNEVKTIFPPSDGASLPAGASASSSLLP